MSTNLVALRFAEKCLTHWRVLFPAQVTSERGNQSLAQPSLTLLRKQGGLVGVKCCYLITPQRQPQDCRSQGQPENNLKEILTCSS